MDRQGCVDVHIHVFQCDIVDIDGGQPERMICRTAEILSQQ